MLKENLPDFMHAMNLSIVVYSLATFMSSGASKLWVTELTGRKDAGFATSTL